MHHKMIYVGVIIAPHGVRGLAKIKSFTSPVTNITKMLLQDKQQNSFKLKLAFQKGDIVVCQINDIIDRNIIEKMKGTKFFALRSMLPEITAEDEHYIQDLVGMIVKNNDREELGKVVSVHNFGAGDILEISFNDGENAMFPFTKAAFPHIDKDYIVFIKPDFI